MNRIALLVLHNLEITMFRRTAPCRYELQGLAPEFYRQLFPDEEDGSPCARPWQYSPMLEFFMPQAEEFFAKNESGEIDSGIWMEALPGAGTDRAPRELPLQAWARRLEEEEVFILQCVRANYAERARILRQARNELLEHRKTSNDLITFKNKSLRDSMTNLYNHATFKSVLNDLTKTHTSSKSGLALLFIDIDNFKKINDTYGHLAGDSVLIQLSDIIRKSLRKHDVPARYGGEEFAVLASNTTLQQGKIIGEKLRSNVEKHDFGIGQPVTISIGVSTYKDGEDMAMFINRADQALYDAKHNGKNRVQARMPWLDDEVN
jgi:diguanylate cyclase (GGDEF)-like protein